MSYYRTCPRCGANLDPGEQCTDCGGMKVDRAALVRDVMSLSDSEVEEVIAEMKKAAPGAANTKDGAAEQIETPVSASSVNENKEDVKQ